MRIIIESRAVTTPVLIVQRVMMFKTVSVLTKQEFTSHKNMGVRREERRTRRIDVLFETCAARTQEKDHGTTYDEVCCRFLDRPGQHEPCVFLYEYGE